MEQDKITVCVNGILAPGDLVVSTPHDDYACLVGTVREIHRLGTPEHDAETANDTDDVHVSFHEAQYSNKRIEEIEAMFSKLYGEKKEFGECPIDDAIMAPDSLIRITNIDPVKLAEILDSHEGAAAFCQSALRVRELTDRLDGNIQDYRATMLALDNEELFNNAGEIACIVDTFYYLAEVHEFDDAETEFLLRFENPLVLVADEWAEHTGDMSDFPFALNDVLRKKDDALKSYALYVEPKPPQPLPDTLVDIKQAARYEAERLFYELKKLLRPNAPDNAYLAIISPAFIKQAGSAYDKLLFEAFTPPMPMTFGSDKQGNLYLSMDGATRAAIKVVKPSIQEQLQEAKKQADAHNARNSPEKSKQRGGEAL